MNNERARLFFQIQGHNTGANLSKNDIYQATIKNYNGDANGTTKSTKLKEDNLVEYKKC